MRWRRKTPKKSDFVTYRIDFDQIKDNAARDAARLVRADLCRRATLEPCDECGHQRQYHGPKCGCYYPVGVDRTDCGCQALTEPHRTLTGEQEPNQ